MDMNQDLKNAGLKATAPRMMVLRLFVSDAGQHMSAEDVYKRLLSEGEDIGLATIYRVLTQFQHAGLLSRSNFESGKAIYELNQGEHHDHLVCLQCGHVVEFVDPVIEKRQKEIALERGFAVQDHSLCLFVDCLNPECPNKNG
ncbi:MAG: ferric iron uptake transcriptional regulator [Magnetococcales bacterium]|nr:ferric iron uptake transcriptional regulator [Magnetococcales bacterium]MBF0440197.1 ferric iron uptake transcriptional regulator [Magnetococcales bacterium]